MKRELIDKLGGFDIQYKICADCDLVKMTCIVKAKVK